MALPALLGGAGRALATTSKVSRAVNIGSKFLGRDTKKKKPGIETEKGSSSLMVRPSMNLMGGIKLPTPLPEDTFSSAAPKASPTEEKNSLEENVAYIRKKTIEIDKLLKESFKLRKKEAKDADKMRRALARKEKEDRFESGKKSVVGKVAKKAGKPFSSIFDAIKNYISSIIVGFIAIKLLPLLPKMLELLKVVGPAMDFILGIAGTLLNGLATFIDWGYKAFDATRGFIKGIGGEGAAEAFDKFSGALNTMINLALVLAMANAAGGGFGFGGRGGRGSTRPTTRPGQGLRPKVTTTGGRGVNRPDIRNPLRDRPKVTRTGGGTPGRPDIRNPLRSRPTVTTGAGREVIEGVGRKVTGEAAEQITKKTASAAVGKFIRPFVKRIPILGALIDFAISVALGESVGRAAARATGAGIGGAVGTAIAGSLGTILGSVVPIVGNFLGGAAGALAGGAIGGFVGDWLGGWLYDTIAGVGSGTSEDVKPEDIKPVEAKADGGQVGEEDKDEEQTLQQQQLIPALKTPDLNEGKIGKDIGGEKILKVLYTDKGQENLIRLYNEFKKVPVYGEAMSSAIGMALGVKPSTASYFSMGASLLNFSNLQAAENIASSSAKINQSAQKFESGGQVLVSKVSLDSSIQDTANVAQYLDAQISRINVLPKEDTNVAKEFLKSLGFNFGDDGDSQYEFVPGEDAPTPSPGGAATSAQFGTIEQKKMLDAIAFAEGTTKSYGTLYGGKVIPELAAGEMTIAQVLQMQKSKMYKGENVYGSGYDSNATGRYQFMSYVLEEEIKKQGISPNEKFTPEMQDRLILNRISRMRGVTPALLAKEGMSDKVIDMLAPEFASFPNLFGPDAQGRVGTNTSYYGQGGKSKDEIKKAYGQSTGSETAIAIAPQQPQQKQSGGLLSPITNLFGGGQEQEQEEQGSSKGLMGTVIQWLHGNPSRAGYDAGHAGMSNAHDHFSFNSRSAAVRAFKALKKAGYAPYEFEGFTSVGKHSARGGHFGPVGQPPTYDDKTDGVAFDIPWSSYGSGPIGQRDYDKSYKAAQIVGAAQGGGPVPGAFKELQETMSYDKSKTKVLIQPMIVEKEVPMPMPSGGGGGGIMVMGGEVNNTTDSLAAG